MTSISGTIPNVIGGVSQQTPATRLDNAAETLENAVCSVVTGLRKRPPFELSNRLPSLNPGTYEDVAFHVWERPGGSSRIVAVRPDGRARVYKLDGTEETVTSSLTSRAYLASTSSTADIGFCPIGDALMLYNRKVKVLGTPVVDETIGGNIIQGITTVTVVYGAVNTVSIRRNGIIVASASLTEEEAFTAGARTLLASRLSDALSVSEIEHTRTGFELRITHPTSTEYTVDGRLTIKTATTGLLEGGRVTVVVENVSPNTNYAIRRDGDLIATLDRRGATDPWDTTRVAIGLEESVNDAAIVRRNNVLIFEGNSGEVWTSEPPGLLRTYIDEIQQFSSLPPDELDGRRVRVRPSPDDDLDGYYVRYDASRRLWSESVGPITMTGVDPNTMPVLLADNGDGTWSQQLQSWAVPTVGDPDSNPAPSFVGLPISYMFLFRDRLGVLTDENFIFSQVGEYTNFFRTTVSLIRDDDRLDGAVTVPENGVVNLRSALAFDGNLYLFGDKSQIKLEFNDASPGQFRALALSNFEVAETALPTLVGDRAMFADAGGSLGGFSRIREYRLEAVSGTNQAEDVTRQVPRLIPAGVYRLATSTAVDAVHVLSRGAPEKLYRYDFYNTSEGRVQSAWNTWELPGYVFEGAGVIGRRLYVIVQGYGHRYLASANIEDAFDRDIGNLTANLDMRFEVPQGSEDVRFHGVDEGPAAEREILYPGGDQPVVFTWNGVVMVIPELTGLYSSFEGPPFSVIDNFPFWSTETLWAVNAETGQPYPGVIMGNPNVRQGWRGGFPWVNLTQGSWFVGTAVQFKYKMSPIYMRDAQKTAIHDGRLQLRYLSVMFSDTVAFKAHVVSPGYTPANLPVSGIDARVITSDGLLRRGQLVFPGPNLLRFGKFRFPVATRGEHLDVTLTDDGPFPCAFSSIEWEGAWRPKTKRITR